MSILLKQRQFSAFERPKLMFRVISQKFKLWLIWRGVLGLDFISLPFFCIDEVGSDICCKRKYNLTKLEIRR